jgi:hypothetical protein
MVQTVLDFFIGKENTIAITGNLDGIVGIETTLDFDADIFEYKGHKKGAFNHINIPQKTGKIGLIITNSDGSAVTDKNVDICYFSFLVKSGQEGQSFPFKFEDTKFKNSEGEVQGKANNANIILKNVNEIWIRLVKRED